MDGNISYIVDNLVKGGILGVSSGFILWFLGWTSSQLVHFFKSISR